MARRAAWGVADQAVSSATNFGLGALIARSVSAEAFGSFSLSYLAYTVFLNAARALATTPLVIRFTGRSDEEWRHGTAAATGVALGVGIVCGLLCWLVALATSDALRESFFLMGLLLPGVLLQDAWRFAFFARGHGRSALANDLITAVVMLPAFAVALSVPSDGAIAAFMLAWGGATAVAAVAGCFQAGTIPSLGQIGTWWHDHRDIAPRYLVEFTTQSGAGQIGLALVGVVAGLVALAAIRAGQLLLGVPNVLFQGLELVVMPEAVRVARRSTRSLVTFVRLVAAGRGDRRPSLRLGTPPHPARPWRGHPRAELGRRPLGPHPADPVARGIVPPGWRDHRPARDGGGPAESSDAPDVVRLLPHRGGRRRVVGWRGGGQLGLRRRIRLGVAMWWVQFRRGVARAGLAVAATAAEPLPTGSGPVV